MRNYPERSRRVAIAIAAALLASVVAFFVYYPYVFDARCWHSETRWNVQLDANYHVDSSAEKFASIRMCAHGGTLAETMIVPPRATSEVEVTQ